MRGISLNQTSETTISVLIEMLSTILRNSTYINNPVATSSDKNLQSACNFAIENIIREFTDNGYSKEQISDMFHLTNDSRNKSLIDIQHEKQFQAALDFANSAENSDVFVTNEFEDAVNEIHYSSWNRKNIESDMEKWLDELST